MLPLSPDCFLEGCFGFIISMYGWLLTVHFKSLIFAPLPLDKFVILL
jgi:hypothetical protein